MLQTVCSASHSPPACRSAWLPAPLQEIMRKIGKPSALGPLDENMADDEDDEEEGEGDGIELDDSAGDDLADAFKGAHI